MNIQNETTTVVKTAAVNNLNMTKIVLIETLAAQSDNQLQSKLSSQSIDLVDVAQTTDDLVARIQKHSPDVLVISVDFLDAAMLDQLIKVNDASPLPVAVFAKQSTTEVLKTAISAGVDSYVVDDVQAHRVPTIIDLSIVRFNQVHRLAEELEQTKEKLTERKLIERAKGIIMQQKSLTEDEAYGQMRKSAMNQGQSMAELSRRVISVFEMLN